MLEFIKNIQAAKKNYSILKKELAFFVLMFCSFISFSQVKATLDTANIKIGEEIQYQIQVDTDSVTVVKFPEGQSFLPLEVIEFYPTDTSYSEQKVRLIKKYGLTRFDSGRVVIPQQLVKLNEQSFFTDTLLVEVADVQVDTLKQKMYDIKPAMDVQPVKGKWIQTSLWVLLILLGIILLVYFILRQKKKIEEAKKQLPPFEEALVALQTLDNSQYLRESRLKDYYSSLTEIVKRYLDREVDEAALESTTDELISKLELHKDAGHLNFDKATILKLAEILKRADLIKFAKMQMESGQAQLDRKDIENIIKETHEAIPEPTEEELMRDALYQEQVLKKKRKRNLIAGIVVGLAFLFVISGLGLAVFGWAQLKETLIGHPSKELLETEWIKSEYGDPAITIETPKVLKRVEMPIPEEHQGLLKSMDNFAYGSINGKFYVTVSSIQYRESVSPDLELALDGLLSSLESEGAFNIMIKDEPFSTEKGITGIRAHGDFNFKGPRGKPFNDKIAYEALIFGQTGAIQQILIIYDPEDSYLGDILTRIIDSAEIEIPKN